LGNGGCATQASQMALKVDKVEVKMAIDESRKETPGAAANGKKPYEKPRFRFEQVFETTALACGKVTGGIMSPCHSHKMS
jgi:hypothetical protein